MIGDIIYLASYGFYGGAIGNMLSSWEQAGFFSYLLPFLLIFALIFGILNQVQLFKEAKAINGVIALTVALMALQFEIVSRFFAEIFPRLGIGLSIILVIIILLGLFIDPKKGWIMYTLLGIAAIVVVVVLVNTAGAVGWQTGYFWSENWSSIVGVIVFVILLAVIIGSGRPKNQNIQPYNPFWTMAPGR
jgi:hypothetical protein